MNTTLTQELQGLKNSKESSKPEEQYEQYAYLNSKLITRDVSKASSSSTWIRQGTSRRESTDRPTLPPNSSLTLYLTISSYKTRSYGGLIFP